jgi:hypothetical protein
MQEQLQEILELMKKHKEPGIAVDVSIDLLRRYAPAEQEEFVRKMIEDILPNEITSEEREFIVQKYLSVIESGDFKNSEDSESTEKTKDKEET